MSTRRIKPSLLSLPDELLSAIFSEVEIYRKLWVGDNETQFEVLSELCAKRPDLRALVRVLYVERTTEQDEDGDTIVDYAAMHPCIKLLHSDFPALHTLTVLNASPTDIFAILSRVTSTTRPAIRELTLQCAPGSADPILKKRRTIWWHFLEGLPELKSLAITTTPSPVDDMIVFEDKKGRPVSPLRGLHSLSLGNRMPYTALATLFPDLKSLRLTSADFYALDSLLRNAPTSLTQLSLWILSYDRPTLQEDSLARLPRLERLTLHRVDATVLLPSIQTSRINDLRILDNSAFSDEIMLNLVDGPTRMKNLKVLRLDYVSLLGPEWPQGCTAEGHRMVVDAARKNGIEVYGTVVDCLDWSDRFDEQAERFLVDDALARNDYTRIERYLGVGGAGEAISRQRPRLAELIRKSGT